MADSFEHYALKQRAGFKNVLAMLRSGAMRTADGQSDTTAQTIAVFEVWLANLESAVRLHAAIGK